MTSALEMLAWGLFLGLAFLVIAPIFRADKLGEAIFWICLVIGLLCLLALLGQVQPTRPDGDGPARLGSRPGTLPAPGRCLVQERGGF